MVYEYAIDPTCLSDWHRLRFIADNVGVPKGRLVSEYPGSWRKTIMQVLSGRLPVERSRLEVQYQRITPHLISPHRPFDPQRDWLSNAEEVYTSKPFRAIVSSENPRTLPFVLSIDGLDDTTELWKTSQNCPIRRKAKDMAATVCFLLQLARDVLLIDRHFDPGAVRFRRPFEQFAACCAKTRNPAPPRIRLLTEATYLAAAGDPYEHNCRHYLAPLIPNTLSCELVRIREKTSPAEIIHNRFVLTDRGGVKFGIGLDDDNGQEGQTDDVDLLSQESFDLRWRQYALMQAFDVVTVATIAGTKPVPAVGIVA
jgi:hypothetical protein